MDQEWKDIAPELSKLERRRPYAVPDGYFEALPDRLARRIGQELAAGPARRRWSPGRLAVALSLAAALALGLMALPRLLLKGNEASMAAEESAPAMPLLAEETQSGPVAEPLAAQQALVAAPEARAALADDALAKRTNELPEPDDAASMARPPAAEPAPQDRLDDAVLEESRADEWQALAEQEAGIAPEQAEAALMDLDNGAPLPATASAYRLRQASASPSARELLLNHKEQSLKNLPNDKARLLDFLLLNDPYLESIRTY